VTADPASRIPVIIGAGEINDPPAVATEGMDSPGLMAEALRAADRDAGGGWLAARDYDVQALADETEPVGTSGQAAIGATGLVEWRF
jgi:acetyl-CoA C-acetyltransferase